MAHPSAHVANYIMEVGEQAGLQFTPLQLIKLTYIAHGWSLAMLKTRLIEESAEAWLYGPVFPKLYRDLKKYRAGPVTTRIEGYAGTKYRALDAKEMTLLREVVRVYGRLSGTQLSSLTHKSGTPWHQVWSERGQNSKIPNEVIQTHYMDLLRRDGETNGNTSAKP